MRGALGRAPIERKTLKKTTDSREQGCDRVHAFVFVYLQLSSQSACPVWCSVGRRATLISLLQSHFVFVLFAVGSLFFSAAADAMSTNTVTNSVSCSEPSIPLSSEPCRPSTVAFRFCLRRSTNARTASVKRIIFADTVVFNSKNGKVRKLCPRKVDKSVGRSCVKPLVLGQDCNCNLIYCKNCPSCV